MAHEDANALSLRIVEVINNAHDADFDDKINALMMALADGVASVECRDCRALLVKSIKKQLPKCIASAVEQAKADGLSGQSDHVH
jgi:hypothetical protein